MSNVRIPRLVAVLLVALLAAACGGGAAPGGDVAGGDDADGSTPGEGAAPPSSDQTGDLPPGEVLSSCAPAAGSASTSVVVAGDGPRPPLDEMEAALADSPDAQFVIEERTAAGTSREDAVHMMYAQVVGDELLEVARSLPGFVTGAYARPEAGEPFELAFAGEEVPDGLDPDAFPLQSYGLEVTTGATGFDEGAFTAAYEAAIELGIRVLGGSGDETTGTATIEVIGATPEQVAAWEEAAGAVAATICMVAVEPTEPCDEEVVTAARGRSDPAAEPVPADAGEDRDGAVVAGHVGLDLEDSRARAEQEGRGWRTVVEDGVSLAVTMDLNPGRLNVTACRGVVVDAVVER